MRKTATKFTGHRMNSGRLVLMVAVALGSCTTTTSATLGQSPEHQVPKQANSGADGNSSREAKEAAILRIPFQQLTPEAVNRLKGVVSNSSYFRSMPTETVECDPEMFTFLVRHPEVIVNIWEVMAVTKVTLQRTGPFQLQGSDGAGTASKMDLVYGNDFMHIYFATGNYQGNLWARPLTGNCVLVLHNRPGPLKNGKPSMVAAMDVFMKLDSIGADLVVKTLGPLMGKTADYNFTECAAFLSQISQTAENNPYGIHQLAKKLTKIDPNVRDQFIATTTSVAQRSGNLSLLNASVATSVDKIVIDAKRTPSLTAKSTVPPQGALSLPPGVSTQGA